MIIYIALIILLILEAIIARANPSYAIAIILIINLLIPGIIKIDIGAINLNAFNLSVCIYCIVIFFGKKNKRLLALRRTLIIYAVYIFIALLIATLDQFYLFEFLQRYILFLLEYICLAYAFTYVKCDNKTSKVFDIGVIISGLIIIGYGICNYILQLNPYIGYLSILTDTDDMSNLFQFEQRGFIEGRISSTFTHPLQLGQASVIMFAYSFYQFKNRINKLLYYLICIGLILMCFLCGSRSAIFPIVIILALYIIFSSPQKIFSYFIIAIVVASVGFYSLPKETQTTIKALVFVWDKKASDNADIRGSSIDSRMVQLNDAMRIIKGNTLLGKGEGYVSKYGSKHPEMYGYESIILKYIVDGGVLGLIAFLVFYIKLYRILLSNALNRFDKSRVHSLFISFFVNILLTGIAYSFFTLFMIFYLMTYYSIKSSNRFLIKN